MIPISIDEFVKQVMNNNQNTDQSKLTAACKKMIKLRHNGAACMNCGNSPIWAAGSAITGTAMCFACMTGENDDSEDYEIEEG